MEELQQFGACVGLDCFQCHLNNNAPVTKAGDWKWSGCIQTDGLRQ